MLLVRLLDDAPVIGQRRHLVIAPTRRKTLERHARPIRLEAEFLVGPGEAVDVVRGGEVRLHVEPVRRLGLGERAPARRLQRRVDELARAHVEAAMRDAEPGGKAVDHVVIGAALARRVDQLQPQPDVLVAAAGVEIVVLQKHRRRQDDVGGARRLGHELLVHGDEQVLALKAAADLVLIGRDRGRVGALHEQRLDRRAALERVGLAAEDRADARLIERAGFRIAELGAFEQALVEMEDGVAVVEGAAAFVLPRPSYRGDAGRGMHVRRAVAAAREAVAEAEICALPRADDMGELFDVVGRQTGDIRCPFRGAGGEMRLELGRSVGVAREVVAVGQSIAEKHIHDRAGKRTVRAGPEAEREIGLLHGGVAVDVNRNNFGAALLASANCVRHHVDLRRRGIGAPDDHAIGLRHFARIGPGHPAGPGDEARPGEIDADGGEEARIFLRVGKTHDARAHHMAHRAGIVIRPHALRPEFVLGAHEFACDRVERFVPRDARELP